MKFLLRSVLGAVLAATLAACGGGGDPSGVGSSVPMSSTSSAIHSVDSSVDATDRKAYAMSIVSPPAGGSSGCGAAPGMSTGSYWMTIDGKPREYLVRVPSGYNPSKLYKLIFAFHPRWGKAYDIAVGGFYGMQQQYGEDAIYVAPQGLVDSDPGLEDATGWKNTNDRDIHFVQAMVTNVKQKLCVDNQRVYAMGFSYGGMMSNAIGCAMADVFRGISVAAGALKSGCATSTNEIAAIAFHATDDYFVTFQEGYEASQVFMSRNHCSSSDSTVIGQNYCIRYNGCDGGKAVVFCPRVSGGHSAPPYFAEETKAMWDAN